MIPVDVWAKLSDAQRADIEAHIRGLTDDAETYNAPRRGWTCFHCGETFHTEAGAQLHFGQKVTGRPACVATLRATIHDAIAKHVQASISDSEGCTLIGADTATDEILTALAATAISQVGR